MAHSGILCLLSDNKGEIFLHADAAGLDALIEKLQTIRKKIDQNLCDHEHLMSPSWGGGELTEIYGIDKEKDICHHLKIFGWTEEWAIKHGFK